MCGCKNNRKTFLPNRKLPFHYVKITQRNIIMNKISGKHVFGRNNNNTLKYMKGFTEQASMYSSKIKLLKLVAM